MPRIARIVLPGVPHHITQRGNNRQDVFFTDDDYNYYLKTLAKQSAKYGLSISGYCLMSNHIHVICTPDNPEALAKGIGRTNFIYTQYVNLTHGRSGHLWQNRFFSCALDDEHMFIAMCYIEQNPMRAGITDNAVKYKWSSAKPHVSGNDPLGIVDMDKWSSAIGGVYWKRRLNEPLEDNIACDVRRKTQTGRPFGDDKFVSSYEKQVKRRLRAMPVGRPKQ